MIRDAEAPADAARIAAGRAMQEQSQGIPMNKVAIAAAALLVIALLSLPGLVGAITEANVRERVAAIDASAGATAELTSYERGWFGSTARIKLGPENDITRLTAAPGALGILGGLPILVELAHGPVAVLDGVYFGWSKVVARPDEDEPGVAELTQTLDVPHLFEFRGRTPYLGGLTFDADAPPFMLPLAATQLTFSGGTVAGKLAGQRLEADAQIGSFDLAYDGGTVAVRGLQASADNELRSEYVMPGEASFSIASITVAASPSTPPMFATANLRMNSDVDIDAAGELLEMHVTYDVDSVRIEENELSAGSLGVSVAKLDVAAVEAYGALVSDAAASGADPATLTASLGPHLERALQRGPSVTFDPIRFRYDDEPFEGRIEVTANPTRLPPAGTLSLDEPLLMLSVVNVKAELRLSKTLAGQLATLGARMQLGSDATIPPDQLDYMAEAQSGLMLTMLVGQGILIEDGDGYRTSFDYTDGSMTLNGSPLPFGLP
jgi:uncharacterized protein YdgA (DUF945 family)